MSERMAAVSYGGGAVSVLSAMTLTDVGVLVGIATAILTFAANMYFRWAQDRREREEHARRIEELQRNPERRAPVVITRCMDNPPADCPYSAN